jgi:hypothetical protein
MARDWRVCLMREIGRKAHRISRIMDWRAQGRQLAYHVNILSAEQVPTVDDLSEHAVKINKPEIIISVK